MKKNNFIKIIALVLSMICVLSALVACDKGEDPKGNEGGAATINGIDVSEYTIVYGKNEPIAQEMAYALRDAISSTMGVSIAALNDDFDYAGGKEILVGHSKRTNENGVAAVFAAATAEIEKDNYVMYAEGDFLFIGGAKGSNVAIRSAANVMVADIKSGIAPTYDQRTPLKPENVTTYRIVTYNDGDNATTNVNNVVNFLLEMDPDIVGMQEVRNMDGVSRYPSLMKGYKSIYFDHETANRYGAPILYKTDKFSLVDSGTKWLSDTPDVLGSKYDESAYIRSYVYAILEDKQTGQEIVVINTHIDYIDDANTKQVKKLLELTEEFQDKIVIYTADWNMTVGEPGFELMNAAGYTDGGTAYGKTIPKSGSYIDFIFVDTKKVTVNYYEFFTNHKYSANRPEAASDHNPVLVEIAIFG